MRFYTTQHSFYCGIARHARTRYVCILRQDGEVVLHRNMTAAPEPFLKAVAPYRDGLVVAVECTFTWDLARRPVCARRAAICPRACLVYASHPRRQGET